MDLIVRFTEVFRLFFLKFFFFPFFAPLCYVLIVASLLMLFIVSCAH